MMADQTMNEMFAEEMDTVSIFWASLAKVVLNTDAYTTTYAVKVYDTDQILSLLSDAISFRSVHQ